MTLINIFDYFRGYDRRCFDSLRARVTDQVKLTLPHSNRRVSVFPTSSESSRCHRLAATSVPLASHCIFCVSRNSLVVISAKVVVGGRTDDH
jgi:hypothetical protein